MRQLAAIGTVAALLLVVATVAWGWPGVWSLLAVPPALLVGSALSRAIDAWMGLRKPRPVFVTLGGAIGTFAAMISLLFMWAVHAPEAIEIEERRTLDQPGATVWRVASEPRHWPGWDAMLIEAEPVGDADSAAPGAEWRTRIAIAGQKLPTRHVVTEIRDGRSLSWRVELPEEARIGDIRLHLALTPRADGTDVVYRVAYRVDSVFARALDRLMIRAAIHESARGSLDGLADTAEDLARAR